MDIDCVSEFFDLDPELLHNEILCAVILLDGEEPGKPATSSNTTAGPSNLPSILKRRFTATFLERSKADEDRAKERHKRKLSTESRPTTSQGFSSTNSVNDMNLSRKRRLITEISEPKKVAFSSNDNQGVNAEERHCCGDDDILLHLSDDPDDEEIENENQHSHSDGSGSQSLKSSSSISSKVKMDLEKLCELLTDPYYLNGFCYEQDGPNDAGHRTFNVYSVDNKISFAAFHSPNCLANIRDRTDCKLFFYYSEEMLRLFHGFTEMEFVGINHFLMVYVNHFKDRVRPFAYFLLPNKNPGIIHSALMAVGDWLNANGPVVNVTKCTTSQDQVLQNTIAEIWPEAKVIGCSSEYQNDIKTFAQRNQGLTTENTTLTRMASVLCHLPDVYIPKGMKIIQTQSTKYSINLAAYLSAKWLGRPISVHGENIVQRSVTVCKRFNDHMIRGTFRDNVYRKGKILKNCWDFLEHLKIQSKINSVEMKLDGTKFAKRKQNFEFNTKKQKDKETNIVNIRNNLEVDLKVMSEDEAVMKFMQKMILCK